MSLLPRQLDKPVGGQGCLAVS